MHIGLTASLNSMHATLLAPPSERLEMESQLSGSRVTLGVRALTASFGAAVCLDDLRIDGRSILDRVPDPTPPELAVTPYPGSVSGNGAIVTALSASLEIDAVYLITYEILENADLSSLVFPASNGAPFTVMDPPQEVGVHHIFAVAKDSDTRALLRLTGTAEFGFVSCRKVQWRLDLPPDALPNQDVTARITYGDLTDEVQFYIPEPGIIYVAPNGSDVAGTGAMQSPFRQPAAAVAVMQAGDTAYLRPGIYDPFRITSSGTPGNPITFTTLAGEERQAIIQGDLSRHAQYGGPGAGPRAQAARGGVEIIAQDHIHLSNLTIEDMPFDGIHIEGDESAENLALDPPVRHGNHVVAGCRIRNVGNSAIWGGGYFTNKVLRADLILTDTLLFEHNDISETNVATDYNNNVDTNSQGEPGGVNEAISVAGGVANVITRYNDIHDSRQYGIDYKHGTYGGQIHGNRIWNMVRYGIYLDTNRRTVENIDVFENEIWSCNLGIVLAREADFDPIEDVDGSDMVQVLRNINIRDNLIYDCRSSGIFCQRHPGDSPHGSISNVRIYNNTLRDCARSGSGNEIRLVGWSDADFVAADVTSGFELTGNTLSRAHTQAGTALLFDQFSGTPGFTVSGNIVE